MFLKVVVNYKNIQKFQHENLTITHSFTCRNH